MPCMGPSKDHAYEVGEQVWEDVKRLLEETYHVREPKIVEPDFTKAVDERARLLMQALVVRSQVDKDRWDENMEKLKTLLQEIVWEDHASGF